MVASVLSQEISRDLRHERAVSYGTTATVSRVDADQVMILLATDIVPAEHSHSVDLVTRVVRSFLASGEPTRILHARDQLVRHLRDDPIALWQATSASTAVLRGSQPHDEREALQRLGEVSAADLMGQIEQFWSSALITSPAGAQSVTDIPFTTGMPDVLPAPDALEFVSRSAPADASRAHLGEQTLTFSDTGRDGVPQRRGVELDDAAALLVFPDGARQVVSRHGTRLHVEPNRWRDGDELVRRLERLVPTERWVPMGEREPTSVPSPGSRWSWLTTQLVHFLARRRVASILAALLVVVGIQLVERVHFSAPEERMSTALLESTVDSFYTRYFRTDVIVDCHGASPKIGEAVSCTLVWGPMRRTAVRAVVPFRCKGSLGLEYLSGETLTRQVPAPAGPLAPLAPLASPTEGPATPSPLHG